MTPLRFIDLFAGCGGLSLGLAQAGLKGVLAIERDAMAFETFKANFLDTTGKAPRFEWPDWLERKNWDIDELLEQHLEDLRSLEGQIDVLAGGPPCQGFSFAGRRQEDDPRNLLFNRYAEVVEALKPKAIVLENVPGMMVLHKQPNVVAFPGARQPDAQSYYERLLERLDQAGYVVSARLVDSSRFGVPQRRSRLIAIGLRKDLSHGFSSFQDLIDDGLEIARKQILTEFRLPEEISSADAISDLESSGRELRACIDPQSRVGYVEVAYDRPLTRYQKLLHAGHRGPMDSMRMARHRPEIQARFQRILNECRRGVPMDEASRRAFGLRKQRTHPMSPTQPSPTITTLPDDILHYGDPRILTVRESARLQSFPDWFEFKGKFTTGGHRRKKECPRYTQVGNAVPPFLGRAIGLTLSNLLAELPKETEHSEHEFMLLPAAAG